MNKTITILRHGEAEPLSDSDANRELTDDGLQGCRSAANTLVDFLSVDKHLDAIFHSPFKRTTQTAFALLQGLSHSANSLDAPCLPSDMLLENVSPKLLTNWLDQLNMNHIVLVSHQPLVSRLVAWLVDGFSADIQDYNEYCFYPATMMVIETDFIAMGCGSIRLTHHFERQY
ncbi:MAG: hypothetical protein CL691_07540 [Cellvibrionales bacterium]|nr:hypothetical protein [Cellvibrionales bacterium]|tara:strand:+ start:8254 stop:8772 length:519 start_codon:yes stop_codon:yes gene_type:complete